MGNERMISNPADLIIIGTECGDWHGLYVNGELYCEGHAIYERDWINVIRDVKVFSGDIESYWVSDEDMDKLGWNFPYKFSDIPKELLKDD